MVMVYEIDHWPKPWGHWSVRPCANSKASILMALGWTFGMTVGTIRKFLRTTGEIFNPVLGILGEIQELAKLLYLTN